MVALPQQLTATPHSSTVPGTNLLFTAPQVRMRALQESTHELQGRLDSALAEKAALHRQWLELRRQLAECTAQDSQLAADTLPCKRVRLCPPALVSVPPRHHDMSLPVLSTECDMLHLPGL